MASQETVEPKSGEQTSLEQRAFLALVKASAKLEAGLNRLFRQFELTNATYSILLILSEQGHEGASCGQIASRLIAEVPDMTRLLDRLERIGYVRRERSKADRRMVRVSISDKGSEVIAALREPVGDYYRSSLGHLSQEKLLAMLSLLDEVRGEPSGAQKGGGSEQALELEL